MNYGRRLATAVILLTVGVLGACSALPENVISKPEVKLRDVQVIGLGFQNQTFLLSFDISNPNPFPLPVNHVSYGVRLDGQRFASGKTASDVSVPAGGESRFAISVELDLLSTAPQLLSIIRDGTRREIPYQLDGQLGIDIPMTPPVTYRTEGSVRLDSSSF
jgi:LEA14-like dessication related protein